ncbi:hypothetical protein TSOC_001590 [Tetrabaena socialis]|uniref:N-acetyltransferase domain-containing protein n=1 Tax=Tetrabaena socialis TaxID=47790 RepID=A0A2J8AG49_9CHLO|nr:hypothetical protein TSOC_001590 [Tetrabaena socialis]|eukprot:PNH11494.1 hypothetical protein TSOC_001590 [Tetrabaena socialis]
MCQPNFTLSPLRVQASRQPPCAPSRPQADPRQRRAYLSNVCVAPAARRLGVARSLLQHAEQVARREGVEWLYVHVVADNRPALTLYCDAMGYQVEQSESEGTAHTLQRPRRLLLAKQLA